MSVVKHSFKLSFETARIGPKRIIVINYIMFIYIMIAISFMAIELNLNEFKFIR